MRRLRKRKKFESQIFQPFECFWLQAVFAFSNKIAKNISLVYVLKNLHFEITNKRM
jgi:hypothetical protein